VKQQVKHRIIGLSVLLAFSAIFLPVFFHKEALDNQLKLSSDVPIPPESPVIHIVMPNVTEVKASAAPQVRNKPSHLPVNHKNNARVIETKKVSSPHVSLSKSARLQTKFVWVIQLGSFSSQKNAKRLLSKLHNKGLQSYAKMLVNGDGKSIVKVFVSSDGQLAHAQILQLRLKKEFRINGIIRKNQI
jgi:cell division septation protein DedD